MPWLADVVRMGYVVIGPAMRGEDLFTPKVLIGGKALTCENSTNTLRLYNDFTEAEKRGTKVHDVTLGGRYDLDGILFKVLGVANPELTTGYKNRLGGTGCGPYNDQSVILRVEDDTKSVVFLGDAGQGCGEKLFTVNSKYKKDLDCDYLQMAHHGQQGVKESFYKGIKFSHCLWPTPKWVWDAPEPTPDDTTHSLETWRTRKWMDEIGIPPENHHVAWRDIDWHLA